MTDYIRSYCYLSMKMNTSLAILEYFFKVGSAVKLSLGLKPKPQYPKINFPKWQLIFIHFLRLLVERLRYSETRKL